jgi:hypothetical protein
MGIGQILTMPLFFASNAIYPISIMPGWLQVVSRLNPRGRHLPAALSDAARRLFALAGVAAVLGGVHGLLSWQVAQRAREVGIRMALGDDARALVRGVGRSRPGSPRSLLSSARHGSHRPW